MVQVGGNSTRGDSRDTVVNADVNSSHAEFDYGWKPALSSAGRHLVCPRLRQREGERERERERKRKREGERERRPHSRRRRG